MTHTTGAQFCTTHCNASRSSRLVTKLASAGLLQASQYTAIYCIHLRAYSYIHIQYYNNKLRCSRVGTVVYVPTSQPIVDALLHEPKFSVISAEGIAVSFTNAAGNIQSISPSNHCSGASASRGGFDSSTMIAYFIDQSGSRFGSGSKDWTTAQLVERGHCMQHSTLTDGLICSKHGKI